MNTKRIVKRVQRYGVIHIPSTRYVETGFNTRVDADFACKVHQRAASNPDDFSVVETSLVNVYGTKEVIEGWLGRDIDQATAPSLKENLRPKCPPFVFQRWGYQKGPDGITHDEVWFQESVLKSKGNNLLKRLAGTKSKPVNKSIEQQLTEWIKDNPLSMPSDRRDFLRSKGLSKRQASRLLYNRKHKVLARV